MDRMRGSVAAALIFAASAAAAQAPLPGTAEALMAAHYAAWMGLTLEVEAACDLEVVTDALMLAEARIPDATITAGADAIPTARAKAAEVVEDVGCPDAARLAAIMAGELPETFWATPR